MTIGSNSFALARASGADRPLLSVISPAYGEAANLSDLHQRLCGALSGVDIDWEWVIVDDHSKDATYAVATEIAARDARVRVYRLSRNFGSHVGILCGLDHAAGDCAIIMAADLQDPPEIIPRLVEEWQAGNKVVWAVRAARHGEKRSTLLFSRLYYWMMRRVAGLQNIPASGADFLLLDRCVIDAVRTFNERNASLFALVAWIGFQQTEVLYDKQMRVHGRSKWTLGKKIKLAIDSLASFSYLPIRWISLLGFATAACGLSYAVIVIFNALLGQPVQGWSSLMIAVLTLGGGQMLMLGILGEYIWRALDEARRRPKYILESTSAPATPVRPLRPVEPSMVVHR